MKNNKCKFINIRIRRLALSLVLFLAALSFGIQKVHADDEKQNVVLITLDGVRWQEVLTGFPDRALLNEEKSLKMGSLSIDFMLSKLGISDDESTKVPQAKKGLRNAFEPLMADTSREFFKEGVILGTGVQGYEFPYNTHIFARNQSLCSLPAYQNIMAGSVQDCKDNDCDFIKTEPMTERLLRELNFEKILHNKIAAVSSWEKIEHAVKSKFTSDVFTNTGPRYLMTNSFLPLSRFDDEVAWLGQNPINLMQDADRPPASENDPYNLWKGVRKDIYTVLQAQVVIREYKPRFLFISLNDTDSFAHEEKYSKYIESIRNSDRWIQQIEKTLWDNGYNKENTTIIITTDHGRGADKKNWGQHGDKIPESDRIWLMAKGPFTYMQQVMTKENHPASIPVEPQTFSHSDIRPTIEAILGLCPISCKDCGKPIDFIVNKDRQNSVCKK